MVIIAVVFNENQSDISTAENLNQIKKKATFKIILNG